MELKEVVNLRNLEDFYNESSNEERCSDCPFRAFCNNEPQFKNCLIEKMLGFNVYEDLYEIEMKS